MLHYSSYPDETRCTTCNKHSNSHHMVPGSTTVYIQAKMQGILDIVCSMVSIYVRCFYNTWSLTGGTGYSPIVYRPYAIDVTAVNLRLSTRNLVLFSTHSRVAKRHVRCILQKGKQLTVVFQVYCHFIVVSIPTKLSLIPTQIGSNRWSSIC